MRRMPRDARKKTGKSQPWWKESQSTRRAGPPAKQSEEEVRKLKEIEDAEIKDLEQRIVESTPNRGEQPTEPKTFDEFPLSRYTRDALSLKGFINPTQIQIAAIPHALAGRDILGAAKTGSGKTLAFLIPALERLYRMRWTSTDGLGAVVISPTRELAMQIFEVLRTVGKNHSFSAGLVVGGKDFAVEQSHVPKMSIIVCTPGRLLQHLEQTAGMEVTNLQVLVLDEADRILDLGFSAQLNSILQYLPRERQTMLFSATQTKTVKDLARLSLNDPEYLGVHEKAASATPEGLVQNYMLCEIGSKIDTLWSFVKTHLKSKTIVFLATCRQVRFVTELFCKMQPGLPVMSLHGKIKQERRTMIYYDFINKPAALLFATDIAARGLDFPSIDWVLQMDCPEDTAMYIHRVGRTARYNRGGKSLLLLLPSEEAFVTQLEEAKIPLSKITANPKKLTSIQGKVAALTAEHAELKALAQKAFMSYVRSVHLMPDREIFNVQKLKMEELAHSFGLLGAPRIKFLSDDLNREGLRNAKNVNKKLEGIRAKIKAEKERKRQMREELKKQRELEAKKKAKAGSDSSSDNSEAEDSEAEKGDDDFLVVKRKIDWSKDEEVQDESETEKPKKKLKIRPDGPVESKKKVLFNEHGEAISSRLELLDQNDKLIVPKAADLKKEAEKHAAEVAARLKLREQEDREREKERVREKHKKRRLKEKGPKAEDDAFGGAVLAPVSDNEDDDDDDAAENESNGASAASDDDEENEGSSRGNSEDESDGSDDDSDVQQTTTKVKKQEDLVMKLLAARKK